MFVNWWKRQTQAQTGPGLAVQAGQNVTINVNGLTVEEVRSLALDVYKANMLEFKGVAQQTAMQRGEAITDKFLAKLQESNPQGIREAQTPDFQDALFTVQKEYAKANDDELGGLLVDLLVDRTKQNNRDLMQLVLTQSLATAPKLTTGQIATLTIVFMFRYVQQRNGTHAGLRDFFAVNVQPFITNAATTTASFGQLEFAGCGKSSLRSLTLEEVFHHTYTGLFNKGFDEQRLSDLQLPFDQYPWAFVQCLNDNTKLQVNALSRDGLKTLLDTRDLTMEARGKIENLFNEAVMNYDEMRVKILEIAPFLEPLFEKWNSSGLKDFELTSVGMAIGHANAKRITGVDVAPLSIWIN